MPDGNRSPQGQNDLQMRHEETLMNTLTIRQGLPTDAVALEQLAALDSSRPLSSPVLVGEIDGELWAAVSVDDYRVIADPFRPSGALAPVLVERARQLRRSTTSRMKRPALSSASVASGRNDQKTWKTWVATG
jgi:hypothetical protein